MLRANPSRFPRLSFQLCFGKALMAVSLIAVSGCSKTEVELEDGTYPLIPDKVMTSQGAGNGESTDVPETSSSNPGSSSTASSSTVSGSTQKVRASTSSNNMASSSDSTQGESSASGSGTGVQSAPAYELRLRNAQNAFDLVRDGEIQQTHTFRRRSKKQWLDGCHRMLTYSVIEVVDVNSPSIVFAGKTIVSPILVAGCGHGYANRSESVVLRSDKGDGSIYCGGGRSDCLFFSQLKYSP